MPRNVNYITQCFRTCIAKVNIFIKFNQVKLHIKLCIYVTKYLKYGIKRLKYE